MLQINPKKFKQIQNDTIPSPLRPKFRNKTQTNIYFLSKKRFDQKKRDLIFKNIKITLIACFVIIGGYYLSN